METLAVIGLVANIVQFVDLSVRAIKSIDEIRQSARGMTKETESLETVTETMRDFSLTDLSLTADSNNSILQKVEEQTSKLQRGVTVTSFSKDAQQQIRSLLGTSQDEVTTEAQHQIRRGLSFELMRYREEAIMPANSETFQWLLSGRATSSAELTTRARETFLQWLSSGSGIFHICGKPASGKSTMMKFLYNDRRTQERLVSWAGSSKLVRARFFFWSQGASSTYSIHGMKRSLLHDILEACPELVPVIFPDEWLAINSETAPKNLKFEFTVSQVHDAFGVLLDLHQIYERHRFCIFVDALDELQETHPKDHYNLVCMLQDWGIASNGNVKFCVSSREYAVFDGTTSGDHWIRVEDMNREDISRFARDKFRFFVEDEVIRERCVKAIASRAEGVFLWAQLAIQTLQRSYDEGDTLDPDRQLDQTLLSTPYAYRHWFSTKSRKGRQIYAMIALLAKEGAMLPLFSCSFLELYSRDPKTGIGQGTTIPDAQKIGPGEQETWMDDWNSKTRKLVEDECGHLVSITNVRQGNGALDSCITFTHQSVLQFLDSPEAQAGISGTMADFDTVDAISQLLLATLRYADKQFDPAQWSTLIRALSCVRTRSSLDKAPYHFLEQLEMVIYHKIGQPLSVSETRDAEITGLLWNPKDGPLTVAFRGNTGEFSSRLYCPLVLPIYLYAGLGNVEYVAWKLRRAPRFPRSYHDGQIILTCLFSSIEASLPDPVHLLDCVSLLLEDGYTLSTYRLVSQLIQLQCRSKDSALQDYKDRKALIGKALEMIMRRSPSKTIPNLLLEYALEEGCEGTTGERVKIWMTSDMIPTAVLQNEYVDWKDAPSLAKIINSGKRRVPLRKLVQYCQFDNGRELLRLVDTMARPPGYFKRVWYGNETSIFVIACLFGKST
ncbi:uncharacterized protein J4E79_011272 [Alternaria viburni]|uniref:uncharacterized protein n=1 Tax=Alternaria viburni TaxID=566460 RepID=UPI0020C38C08|nr:uncharacterized protein J4E79_011272 [Alternaria viburni]KAI4643332.1 hypothetical protein J4E79_011272 [Alternaria viburni]